MPHIKHVVMLSFKETASKNDIHAFFSALQSLGEVIPGIQSLSFGVNNSPEGLTRGCEHAFIIEFESEAYRDDYLEHPDHINFVNNHVAPLIDLTKNPPIVLDFSDKTL